MINQLFINKLALFVVDDTKITDLDFYLVGKWAAVHSHA